MTTWLTGRGRMRIVTLAAAKAHLSRLLGRLEFANLVSREARMAGLTETPSRSP